MKKLVAILMIIALTVSMAACSGTGVKTDKREQTDVAKIQDYLGDAGAYFTLAREKNALENTTAKENALDDYIEAAKENKDLPEELVNSYVESFKKGMDISDNGSEADEELKDTAKNHIKAEMVIELAYASFSGAEITNEMREAKATELADTGKYDKAALYTAGNDTYLIDSLIKEAFVRSELEAAWESLNGGASSEDASAEESSAAESTEDVSEETTSTEETTTAE